MRFITTILAFLVIHAIACHAGTIRDDRDDSLYTGLASQPQFRASGYLRIGTAGVGSGTLIDPHWVLTAGHCVIDENGPTATTWRFEIGGQVVDVPIESVYFPPAWIASGFDAGYDVALLRLPTAFRGVRPAALYTDRDEVGKVITTLGYGTTGNGQTGNLLAAGTRRAGQNTIDATSAFIQIPGSATAPLAVGSDRTIIYDFDSPSGATNTIGSAKPLNLEYSGAPGDSGGGAFVMAGSGSRVLGVMSQVYSPNGRTQSVYGTTAVYARVSSNLDWIRSVMAGRELPMPTVLAQVQQGTFMRAAAMSRQRNEASAAIGFQVARFVQSTSAAGSGSEAGPSAVLRRVR